LHPIHHVRNILPHLDGIKLFLPFVALSLFAFFVFVLLILTFAFFCIIDLSTRPFCITTHTRPLNWSDISSRSMDPDNTSADFAILRNSPKFFSSFELSG